MFYFLNTGVQVVEWWCMGAVSCNSVCDCEGDHTARTFASSAAFSECSTRGTQWVTSIFRSWPEPQWERQQVWNWQLHGVFSGTSE